MDGTTLDLCPDEIVSATHLANELLDGDDALFFVLHDNAGNTLGNIYASNDMPEFDLSTIPNLVTNTVYYISAVAGNDNGIGGVDFNDNCLSVSQGTPFIIHDQPAAGIIIGDFICPEECATLLVTMSGAAPFSVDYEVVHPIDGTQIFNEATNDNFFNITVCADGIENDDIVINLLDISDQFCVGNILPATSIINIGNNSATGEELYSGCQGDGYFVVVNGNIYNEAMPIGSENLMSVAGCDSIVSINLEFNDILAGSEEYSGCQGDGYFVVVNGNIYNEAMPIGSENLMSVAGCDSIVSINLEFNDILAGSEEYSGCQGDGYFVVVNGNIYNEAMPIGSENLMSVAGCDSIVSINLEFNDILAGSEEYSGCQGDGYFVVVNGNIYNEAMPIGSENLMSVAGCDSIVSINLEFNDILGG